MAGNPFRRKQLNAAPTSILVGSPRPSFDSSLSEAPSDSDRRGSKVKRVRIQTPPPLSPDTVFSDTPPNLRAADEPYPTPPQLAAASKDITAPLPENVAEDPFDEADEELNIQAAIENTRRNSETSLSDDEGKSEHGIRNPFSRTLATMEAERLRSSGLAETQISETPISSQDQNSKTNRPALDVDAFKRLLMTGTAANPVSSMNSPSPSTATTTTGSYFTGDSSSITDTSSLSRHSLKESPIEVAQDPFPELPQESPSSRNAVSTAANTSSSHGAAKLPPPPPKPRHGKTIGPKVPQTVSFSDFEMNDPITPTARKSLPPLPPAKAPAAVVQPLPFASELTLEPSSMTAEESIPESSMDTIAPTRARSESLQSQSRSPPPPPLARRSSQARTRNQTSSSSQATQVQDIPQNEEKTNMPSKAPAPPPPPSRRAGVPASESMVSTPRTLSTIDRSPSSASSASGRGSIPPPPPPPRRRGSSKSSVDTQRTLNFSSTPKTIDMKEASHAVSDAADPQQEAPARLFASSGNTVVPPRANEDILADLSALQAEVDALRSRFQKSG